MASASFRVSYAPRVAEQMDKALDWWRQNRRAAPTLLADEIDAALELVTQVPAAGRQVLLRGYQNVRRIPLRHTRYVLFYQVDFDAAEVRLVSFRHARRRPPRQ